MEQLGLGDRVLDIDAPVIRILLVEGAKENENPLESVSFPEGVRVRDRDGIGRLDAGTLTYYARAGRLEADKGVSAAGPGGKIDARRVVVGRPKDRDDVVAIGIFGKKRLELGPSGKLGPLSRVALRSLVFTSTGPLLVEQFEGHVGVGATGSVRVLGDERELLSCERLTVALADKKVRGLDASGKVVAHDPETGAEIRAGSLFYSENTAKEVRLEGNAEVVQPGKRTIRASRLRYRDDGTFSARHKVEFDAVIAKGKGAGQWKFRATDARGKVSKKQEPEHFAANGVVADGPQGEHLEADHVQYDKKTGLLSLRGKPARLRQGEDLSYEGATLTLKVEPSTDPKKPKAFELRSAETAREATIVVKVKLTKGKTKNQVARWVVDLKGPAKFDGSVVRVPAGAELTGYDARGQRVLEGESANVTIEVERSGKGFAPTALRGSGGVKLTGYKKGKKDAVVEGETLDYVVGSRRVEMGGDGTVRQPGSEKPVRFRKVVFELTDDGVNLKYLSELKGEVR
jgi:lipopolysaccharide export system protein LptA